MHQRECADLTHRECLPRIRPLNVYDGVRHFLFIVPAFALLAAEPLGMLLEGSDGIIPRALRWAAVLLISLSAVPSMVALHPYGCSRTSFCPALTLQISQLKQLPLDGCCNRYQSSYFNELVGGLGNVGQEPPAYDTDYWATCYREATKWSVQHAGGTPRHILAAANDFSKECIQPFAPPDWNVSTMLDASAPRLPIGVDYYLSTTRWDMHQLYPDSTVIHRVERAGVTLCLVKSDRADAQASAHPSSRAASPGGRPHQLLTLETIRDGNTPPPPPPPPPQPQPSHMPLPSKETPIRTHSTPDAADSVLRDPDAAAATASSIAAAAAKADLESSRDSLMAHKPLGVLPPPPAPTVDPSNGLQPVVLPSGSVDDQSSAMHSYEVGNTLRDSGRFEEAIQRFTESINRDNSSPAAYNNLGAMLEGHRRVQEALHIYELAVERHPDFALGFFNLGSRLLLSLPDDAAETAASQLADATKYLQRSVELNPAYFPAWSNLGDAKRAVKDVDGAVTCYLEALSRSPTYEVARNNLGNALKTGAFVSFLSVDFSKTLPDAQRAIEFTNAISTLL